MQLKQILFIGATALALYSCGGKGDSTTAELSDSTATAEDASAKDSSMFLASGTVLPSPMQIANIYAKAGVKYLTGVTNSPDNQSKYTSTVSKSLNLGVYTADLAYCILNEQPQQGLLYLKSIKQLSDGAGLSGIFESQAMLTRFEKNIGNKDSLTQIMSDFNSDSDFFFEENDKQTQSVIIFTGGWIESFYIASNVGLKTKNDVITNRLAEQKMTLDKLVPILTLLSKNEAELKPIAEEMAAIRTLLNSVESIKSQDPDDIDFTSVKLTPSELKTIAEAAKKLRTKVVSI
ncbi:MAG: hypothetical protein V4667_08545 [Bacteroidota bacterium]